MSKRAGESLSEELSERSSKNRKVDENANLVSVPKLTVNGDWNVHHVFLEDYFDSESIDDDSRKVSILITSLE